MEFLKHLNSIVKKQYPGILLIAQEDGLWPQLTDSVENDHLGFDYKWSGGWTKDLLSYLEAEPLDRRNYYDQLTLSMMYAYSEHYVLTLGKRDVGTLKEFLEKLPGSSRQKDAQLRAAYGYLMLHPGVKMTAPDGDVGPEMRAYLHDLNELYRNHPALYAMMVIRMGLSGSSLLAMMRMWLRFFVRRKSRKKRFLRCVIFTGIL